MKFQVFLSGIDVYTYKKQYYANDESQVLLSEKSNNVQNHENLFMLLIRLDYACKSFLIYSHLNDN